MFIKQLEIENFKTIFASKIINFQNGINIIVGANGVGKSNILDSIKFLFGPKDYRISNNNEFFHKDRNVDKISDKIIVKLVTNTDKTIKRILLRYPSGKTKSKFYIDEQISSKKEVQKLFNNLDVKIIDGCGTWMSNKEARKYAQELKSVKSQIIAISHKQPIIDVADCVITLNRN